VIQPENDKTDNQRILILEKKLKEMFKENARLKLKLEKFSEKG
jgi:hypothetical protein